ncbi:MAG TPA: hypothetical protein VD731_06040 [Nitrosopumilaceae archaeon]|nr:hypothetical protein [Nitrosopumilaceae archaeon]
MTNEFFQNTKNLSIFFLIIFLITITSPQAFAGVPPSIDTDVTIDFITVNPSSIEIFCTDPMLSGGATITGNVLEIDDSVLFDSVDISTPGLVCDSFTQNIISTASLIDLVNYNLRLTVSTDIPADSVVMDSFVQPHSAILVLDDVPAGSYTIQFRDISVIDGLDPSVDVPVLFPNEIGTLTVTDHTANVDLQNIETIRVKINEVETILSETDVNTGMFQGPIPGGSSVSYDPGTAGLARAIIHIDFDVATGDTDSGFPLVTFAPDEKYDDLFGITFGAFDELETIYRDDVANPGVVSEGDVRLANAATYGYVDGSIVASSDVDVGTLLSSFAPDEKYLDDFGLAPGIFDEFDTVYRDADGDDTVSSGDTRLANAINQGFLDNSVVVSGNGLGDIIVQDVILDDNQIAGSEGFTPVTHALDISFDDGGMVLAGTDITVTMSYANADLAPADDPSLLQMYYQEPGFAYSMVTILDDVASHDNVAKTVVSNPSFDLGFGPIFNDGFGNPLPTIQGSYVLGFNSGAGGGGGGGIAKGGFVVNALGALKNPGGTGSGGNAPPSFGQSSFALISDGEEGFGGILNDKDVKTLEETKTFKVGEKAVLRFDFTEGGGIGKIEHIGLYTNVRDGQKRQDSDAYIYFDPLKSPQVSVYDPNKLFSEANFELLPTDTASDFVLKFEFIFAKPMAKSDLILESWNLQKWSTINKISNAIEVIPSDIIEEVPDESEPIVDTFTEDITDDKVVPIWIKTNAKWWANDQIDSKNFISGIEYLVNEGVIQVSLPDTTNNAAVSELQPWIKSTAGWWADDMISEDEFIAAIEWLISNNIIQVV